VKTIQLKQGPLWTLYLWGLEFEDRPYMPPKNRCHFLSTAMGGALEWLVIRSPWYVQMVIICLSCTIAITVCNALETGSLSMWIQMAGLVLCLTGFIVAMVCVGVLCYKAGTRLYKRFRLYVC
jgi:energy-coupling factor transporter transmembrane protein EcfT